MAADAFTVLHTMRNVNVVKPLQHDAREPSVSPQTILDPKFSRALDFKLRRLKEKEVLEANLRRPTRKRMTASNPNIHEHSPPAKMMSRSNPRVDECGERPRGRRRPDDKPRFVTTVKTGQFLLPPPEVATLLGLETLYPPKEREKIVYSYSNKPKAVAPRSKRSVDIKPPPAPPPDEDRKVHAADAFRNVRSLIAGVAGVQRLLEQRDRVGSLGTTAPYSNVMHERRVVRGSTVHAHAAGDSVDSNAARVARTRRRAAARRAALARLRPGTPPPAPGRAHRPIQTDQYLEELFDKGAEMEVGVQTELFADRPSTPLYVPAKTGADAWTQIYPGDLFDFDTEVQPILEVLVGKTAEQALAEVAQEEELEALREQQRRYRELRDAERAERRRLEEQDRRLHQEKERRVAQSAAAAAAAQEARARAAAAALVRGYVADLLPAALAGLRTAGHLQRELQRGVEEEFMPWLVQEVSLEIESIITSRDVIAEIVREVVEARAERYGAEPERLSIPDSETPPSQSPQSEEMQENALEEEEE